MIPTNAVDGFTQAENDLREGKFEEALKGYLRVVRGVPQHWRSRFRIADTLLNLKAPHLSFQIYKALAWHATKSGHPLWGLVAIKMAAAMDKSQADLVHVVAELYNRDSPRIDRNLPKAPRRVLRKEDTLGDIGFLTGQKLIEEAGRDAANTEGIEDYPAKLPAIPLFSYLDEEAFADVLGGLQLKRQVKGQKVITEGEPGSSFFILAEGDVIVSRQHAGKVQNLARLNYGAVFGEMALIRQAPRTATVSANSDCDLLELSRTFLETETHKLASVTQALHDFTQERFLGNLAATSPIFRAFPRSIRSEIIARFEERPVPPGNRVINEGEEGQGLYLIIKGQVEVTKNGVDGVLATLKEGDVFGEISLLQSSPTTANCAAKGACDLLFLPRKSFNSTMARHPELKAELSKLTAERIKHSKDALDPDDEDFILIEDDDFIML